MRTVTDLLNQHLIGVFFSGDEDCWFDDQGKVHELDRSNRETHNQLASKLLGLGQASEHVNPTKIACDKGWIRLWVEGKVCFIELNYNKVGRTAVNACVTMLQKTVEVSKVWIEDSASTEYKEIDDFKRVAGALRGLCTKREISRMFEDSPLIEMRTDSDEYHELDSADKWLAKYTYENLDKWPSSETLETLIQRYPNKTAMTLYRGMNFRTEDEYDQFMADSMDGDMMTSSGITSWGSKFDAANQFAMVQPTYFPDKETFRQEKLASDAGEIIRGYCGLVLEAHIEPNVGIDVNSSKLGHEDEIILPPGSYQVKLHQIKTFKQQFDDGDETLDNFLNSLASSDDFRSRPISDKWNFILRSKAHELTEEHKMHIFKLFLPKATKTKVNVDDTPYALHGVEREMFADVVWFGYNTTFFKLWTDGLFPQSVAPLVKKVAAKVLADFLKIAKQHPNSFFKLQDRLAVVAELSGRRSDLMAWAKARYGTVYHEMNSKENNQKLKDYNSIYNHTKKLEAFFKQMALFI